MASAHHRLALLQGLLDTDGTTDGHNIEYSTSSRQLAADVQEIVWSLGGTVTTIDRIPKFTHKGETKEGLLNFRVYVKLPGGVEPFRLRRKADKYIPKTKYPPRRYITSVTEDGSGDCVCIKIANPDGLFLTRSYIVTHNTRTVVARVEHLLDQGVKPEEIVVFTFTRRAANELKERLGDDSRLMWVGTFHSVMLDALGAIGRKPSVLDAVAADAVLDQVAILLGHASNKGGEVVYSKHGRGYWRKRIDECRLLPETATPVIAEFASAYASHLRLENEIDYAGILSMG